VTFAKTHLAPNRIVSKSRIRSLIAVIAHLVTSAYGKLVLCGVNAIPKQSRKLSTKGQNNDVPMWY